MVGFISILSTVIITVFVGPSWGSPRIGSALLVGDACAPLSLVSALLLRRAGRPTPHYGIGVFVSRIAIAVVLLDIGLYVWFAFFSHYD